MYDTLTVTKQGIKGVDFVLKQEDTEHWKSDVNGLGEVGNQRNIIHLNEITTDGKTLHNGSVGISYSPKKRAVSLTTSLPKMMYGSSCKEIEPTDYPKVLDRLQEITSPYFEADLKDFNVWRLDNSTNLEVSKEIDKYINVINHSLPSRVGTKDKGTYQGETVMLKDKTETVMFYDKINQALDMKKGDKDLIAETMKDKNLLRYEIQYKGTQGIASKKRYGTRLKLGDIFSQKIIERSAKLRLETFEGLLVTPTKYNLDIDFQLYSEVLKIMRAKNKRAMNDLGWFILLSQGILNVSDIADIMNQADYTTHAIKKTKQRMRSLISKKHKNSNLLDEVYNQVKIKSKVA